MSGKAAVLAEIARRTPARRERYIDLLRAVAITMVVAGHWLAIVVVADGSSVRGFTVLAVLPWTHALTWLFQVMPVFFLVGGYANAISLTRHRSRGGDAVGWLLARSARLVPPTTVLLVTVAVIALTARLLGVDGEQIGTAAWLAAIPLWFLAVYLALVLLTPAMHAAYRRAGLTLLLLLVALVAAGDLARLSNGPQSLSAMNYLIAPMAAYLAGFAWQDGRLPAGKGTAVGLLTGGLSALLILTTIGPYPVSMINVPGAAVQNTSPPTLALIALATAQLGVILLLHERVERRLRRASGLWTLVVAANSVILTVFLWHMSAVIPVVALLHATGRLPTDPVGSPAWMLWKLPWLALLCLTLTVLVAVFGRLETARVSASVGKSTAFVAAALGHRRSRTAATVAGYGATTLGLAGIATAGRADHGPFALATTPLLLFTCGAIVLRLARAAVDRVKPYGGFQVGDVAGDPRQSFDDIGTGRDLIPALNGDNRRRARRRAPGDEASRPPRPGAAPKRP